MADLPYKPDWIASVRQMAMLLYPQAADESTMLLQALGLYERTDELGGQSLSRVLRYMGELRGALGGAVLPGELEGQGWQLLTF